MVYGNDRLDARMSGIWRQASHLSVIDVTNCTNVHMGLGTLEGCGQSTSSHLVAGKDMVNRVDSARAQQGRPAGARENVQGTGNARHLANGKAKTIESGEQKGRRWSKR